MINFKTSHFDLRFGTILLSVLFASGCIDPIGPAGSDDPCYDVFCGNGGTCLDGDCLCTEGWSGYECLNQITPTSMIITRVDVIDFPAYDNGLSWDLNGSAADITISIGNAQTTIYEASTYYSNAVPANQPFVFNNVNLYIAEPLQPLNFLLYNYDEIFGGQSLMGGVNATIYSNTNGFPNTLNVSYSDYEFKLYLDYLW